MPSVWRTCDERRTSEHGLDFVRMALWQSIPALRLRRSSSSDGNGKRAVVLTPGQRSTSLLRSCVQARVSSIASLLGNGYRFDLCTRMRPIARLATLERASSPALGPRSETSLPASALIPNSPRQLQHRQRAIARGVYVGSASRLLASRRIIDCTLRPEGMLRVP